TELGSAPGAAGNMRALPHVEITQIAGLLEQIQSAGGRVDLYRVAAAIDLQFDELLPVVEAVELLGFATVDAGDITLTPLGKKFAEADIQDRKDIFAQQIRRIPVIRWSEQRLTAAKGQALDKDVFLTALGLDFDQHEAPRQFETAISWGRYAEIFSFDDDTDKVFLGAIPKVEVVGKEADPTLH